MDVEIVHDCYGSSTAHLHVVSLAGFGSLRIRIMIMPRVLVVQQLTVGGEDAVAELAVEGFR